jgi:hypothetical protein
MQIVHGCFSIGYKNDVFMSDYLQFFVRSHMFYKLRTIEQERPTECRKSVM